MELRSRRGMALPGGEPRVAEQAALPLSPSGVTAPAIATTLAACNSLFDRGYGKLTSRREERFGSRPMSDSSGRVVSGVNALPFRRAQSALARAWGQAAEVDRA
jgi:hypothetical protein